MNIFTRFIPAVILAMLSCPASAHAQPTKRAVVVGVRKYEYDRQFRHLKYTINDAAKLAWIFSSQGYEVTLLLDEDAFDPKEADIASGYHKYREELAKLKKNPKVTIGTPDKKTIKRAISDAVKASQEDDTLVVYFAGHGVSFENNPKLRSPFFCPSGATLGKVFPMGKLQLDPDVVMETMIDIESEVLGPMAQKTTLKSVLLIDACQNDPKEATARGGVNVATAPKVDGVFAFYSCSEGQKSHESNELGHGLFTLALFDCFHGRLVTGQVQKGLPIQVGALGDNLHRHVTRYATTLNEFKGSNKKIKQEPAQGGSGKGESPILVACLGDGAVEGPPRLVAKVLGVLEAKEGLTKGSRRWDLPQGAAKQFQYFVPVKFKDGERYVGQHEVTQELYEAVMGKNPSKHKGPEAKHRPVEGVTVADAKKFCMLLSAKDKNFNFRLPTLDEMEFLIADGNADGKCFLKTDRLKMHHAQILEDLGGVDNVPLAAICTGYEEKKGLCKDASPNLKLMHIVGNVAEWCTDGKGGHLSVGGCCNMDERQFAKILRDKPALKAALDTADLAPAGGTSLRGVRVIAVLKGK